MFGLAPRSSSVLTTASCLDAEVQRRPQAGMAGQRAALVDDGRMFVEDRGDGRSVASGGRGEQLGQWCCGAPAPSTTARRESDPALVAAFACKGVLHVAKRGLFRCAGIRASKPCAGIGIAIAQRFQPALGSLPQIVEGGHETPPSVRCLASAYSGRKKVRVQDRTRWVGGDSLAADRRRPSAR